MATKTNKIINDCEKSLLNCIETSDLYMLKNSFEFGFYNQTLLLKIINENIPNIEICEEIADFLLEICIPDTTFINFLLSKCYNNNWSEKITQKIFTYDPNIHTLIKNDQLIMFKIPDSLFLANIDHLRDLIQEITFWKIPNTQIANDRVKMLYEGIIVDDDMIFLAILDLYDSGNYDLVNYFIQPVRLHNMFVFMLALNIGCDKNSLINIFDYLDELEPAKCLLLSIAIDVLDSDHHVIKKKYGFDFKQWEINREKIYPTHDAKYIYLKQKLNYLDLSWTDYYINYVYELIEKSKCMLN